MNNSDWNYQHSQIIDDNANFAAGMIPSSSSWDPNSQFYRSTFLNSHSRPSSLYENPLSYPSSSSLLASSSSRLPPQQQVSSLVPSYDQQIPPSYYQLHNSLYRDRSQVFNNSFGEEINNNRITSYKSSYPRSGGIQSLLSHYNPLIHFFKDSSDLKHKILLLLYFMIGVFVTMMSLFGRNVFYNNKIGKEWKLFKIVQDFIKQYLFGGNMSSNSHSMNQFDLNSNNSNTNTTDLKKLQHSKTLLSKYEEEYYDFYKSYLEKQEKKKKAKHSRLLSASIEKYCSQFNTMNQSGDQELKSEQR